MTWVHGGSAFLSSLSDQRNQTFFPVSLLQGTISDRQRKWKLYIIRLATSLLSLIFDHMYAKKNKINTDKKADWINSTKSKTNSVNSCFPYFFFNYCHIWTSMDRPTMNCPQTNVDWIELLEKKNCFSNIAFRNVFLQLSNQQSWINFVFNYIKDKEEKYSAMNKYWTNVSGLWMRLQNESWKIANCANAFLFILIFSSLLLTLNFVWD